MLVLTNHEQHSKYNIYVKGGSENNLIFHQISDSQAECEIWRKNVDKMFEFPPPQHASIVLSQKFTTGTATDVNMNLRTFLYEPETI